MEHYVMIDEKENPYNANEESEYHFTDDDISYEVEPEHPQLGVASKPAQAKLNLIEKIKERKNVLLSGGGLLVLVLIVYKIISPAQTTPPMTIAPAPVAVQKTVPSQPVVAPPITQPAQTAAANPMLPQTAQPAAPAAVAAMQQPAINPPPPVMQPAAPTMQNGFPPSGAALMASDQQPAVMPAAPSAETAQSAPSTQPPIVQIVPEMPAVSGSPQLPATVETRLNANQANADQAATQLSAEYAQKLNESAAQNKALQDQMQTLNARVATMESQMTQLLQALIQQNQGTNGERSNRMGAPATSSQVSQAHEERVAYSVQAIIPGRAWLKSDSGDTVTVAEGDMIKNVGKVTKIDPYDGIVEINTGHRTVSLSYGSNAQ